MIQLADHERGWLAGIVEGEGSITARSNGRTPDRTYPRLAVSMTDEDVVRRLHSVTGVGHVYGPYQGKAPKPFWVWAVTVRKDFEDLREAILPLMGSRRSVRLKEVTS